MKSARRMGISNDEHMNSIAAHALSGGAAQNDQPFSAEVHYLRQRGRRQEHADSAACWSIAAPLQDHMAGVTRSGEVDLAP